MKAGAPIGPALAVVPPPPVPRVDRKEVGVAFDGGAYLARGELVTPAPAAAGASRHRSFAVQPLNEFHLSDHEASTMGICGPSEPAAIGRNRISKVAVLE